MINIRELRIGNLVNIQGNFKKVTGIDYFKEEYLIISDGYYQLYMCKPIPLTEEILLKCGFEESYNSKYRQRFDHKKYLHIGFDFSKTPADKAEEGFRWFGHYIRTIKHLHQIQNIFFEHTNEELNIEL